MTLTQERLKELFSYDKKTGVFTRVKCAGGQVSGTVIKSNNKTPCVKVDRQTYTLATLAWLYVYGELPSSKLKILNGDKQDLRIENIVKTKPEGVLTQKSLKKILSYNPETGIFTRVGLTGPTSKYNEKVGFTNSDGYVVIKVFGVAHKAHRLAFLYMHGSLPSDCVDHINHVRNDNRFANLREASRRVNARNKSKLKSNKSGANGVRLRSSGKYRVTIGTTGYNALGTRHIGQYDSFEDAVAARKEADKLFGYHENHGE